MSGGFFRGTSADQDTRFSNKQAKLLKTQKFAPELEHLVDITKVKMDVIKPWIAKKVTEFLGGFEDEVLINFIYGLLEGKEINGKEVQIQLTGFMEKNTGKFMKELWALLLSAQKNASGVPQQFLDAKEEETRKKKAETDRIFDEVQRRREKEIEQENERKMDGELDNSPGDDSNRRQARGSGAQSGKENRADVQNGFRGRSRSSKSPYSSDHSPSPQRGRSNSRNHSKERSMSRSKSGTPRPKRRSVSPVRRRRTTRRSVSPRRPPFRESISPRRGSYSRRRSSSHSRYKSPSPMRRVRRRSPSPFRRSSPHPVRRRSPSPFRRRSRSPLRHRTPPRRRPRSPFQRRSPSPRRRRSPSPVRQRRRRSTSSPRSVSPALRRSRSPVRRQSRSPLRRRSPYQVRRRPPSPDRRDSPSPRGRRSLSPVRHRLSSPVQRLPVRARRRSPTRSLSRSLSAASRSSASPVRDSSVSPAKMKSPRLQKSLNGSRRERIRTNDRTETSMISRRQLTAMSPMRDYSDGNPSCRRVPSVSPSPEKSPSNEAAPKIHTRTSGENRRLASPDKRAGNQMVLDGSESPFSESDQRVRHGSPDTRVAELEIAREEKQMKRKSIEAKSERSSADKKRGSPDISPSHRHNSIDSRQKGSGMTSVAVLSKEVLASKKSPQRGQVLREAPIVSSKSDEKKSPYSQDARENSKADALMNSNKSLSVHSDSGSEESGKERSEVAQKRKHRRLSRREALSDDSSSESEIEDKKEVKRRKKEERKLRKEERRRRREEKRRRRKEEKRARKRKWKSRDADSSSSDIEENEMDNNPSNGEHGTRKYLSEAEETELQKKRLEIELREKALESLRAKKGISR